MCIRAIQCNMRADRPRYEVEVGRALLPALHHHHHHTQCITKLDPARQTSPSDIDPCNVCCRQENSMIVNTKAIYGTRLIPIRKWFNVCFKMGVNKNNRKQKGHREQFSRQESFNSIRKTMRRYDELTADGEFFILIFKWILTEAMAIGDVSRR